MKTIIASIGFVLAVSSPSSAEVLSNAAALHGLTGIVVDIGLEVDGNPNATSTAAKDQLLREVENKLSSAGIPVVSASSPGATTGGNAKLIVSLGVRSSKDYPGMYAISAVMELREPVLLARSSTSETIGSTWQRVQAPWFGATNSVQPVVLSMADEFIKDYTTANPKKPS
jgi:hypothetical protein